jgi:hypothetical protein
MMSTMDPMSTMSGLEFVELREAARKLETQSLAMKVADQIGVPVETLLHMLPKSAQKSVGAAVQKALERCLQVALRIGPKRDPKAGALSRPLRPPVQHRRMHVAAAAVSGAVGGFFGLPGMLVELPITSFLVQKGAAKEGAPALVSFLSRVAARFGMEVSEKVAAELVPIAGALGGLTLNVMFSRHFQDVAEGHFTVRRLERKYGAEEVRVRYERARRLLLA